MSKADARKTQDGRVVPPKMLSSKELLESLTAVLGVDSYNSRTISPNNTKEYDARRCLRSSELEEIADRLSIDTDGLENWEKRSLIAEQCGFDFEDPYTDTASGRNQRGFRTSELRELYRVIVLDEYNEQPQGDSEDPIGRNPIPKEDLIAELQAGYAALGRAPTASEMAEFGEYSQTTYQNRFGSWVDAIRAADIPIPQRRRSVGENDD